MNIVERKDIVGTTWANLPIKQWARLGECTNAFVYMIKRCLSPEGWLEVQTLQYDYLLVFKTIKGWIAQRESPGCELTKVDYEFGNMEDAVNAAMGLL